MKTSNEQTIWDVSTIMKNAWARAKKRATRKGVSSRSVFAKCLKTAWNIAHDEAMMLEMKIADAARDARIAALDAKRDAGRRVELVSVALKNKLNSGSCWECSEANATKFGLDSSWIGQSICYVYV